MRIVREPISNTVQNKADTPRASPAALVQTSTKKKTPIHLREKADFANTELFTAKAIRGGVFFLFVCF